MASRALEPGTKSLLKMKGRDMVQSVAARLLLAARPRCGPGNLLEGLTQLARRPRGCCRGSTVPRSSRRWALTDCNRQLWAIQPQAKPRSICCRDAPKMLHDIWCRVGIEAVPEYSPVCVLALSIFNENENGRAWSCGSINVKINCRHPSVDRQPTSQPLLQRQINCQPYQ